MSSTDLIKKYPITADFIQTKFCLGTGTPEIITTILHKFLARRDTIAGKILECIKQDEQGSESNKF